MTKHEKTPILTGALVARQTRETQKKNTGKNNTDKKNTDKTDTGDTSALAELPETLHKKYCPASIQLCNETSHKIRGTRSAVQQRRSARQRVRLHHPLSEWTTQLSVVLRLMELASSV